MYYDTMEVVGTMENEINLREYRYGIKWKQSAKGDWYCEQISIKGDTKEQLKDAQTEAIEVMKDGREALR